MMIDNTQKKEIFLKELEQNYKRAEQLCKLSGSAWTARIKRLLFCPDIYIPYILAQLGLLARYEPETRLFWGRKIKFKLKDRGASLFHSNGVWIGEYCLTKFFIKNLKDSDIFYDVGANHGFYTYLVAEFVKEVHSFEPLPFLCEELRENTKNDANIFVNQVALTDKNGNAPLYLSVSSGLSTLNRNVVNSGHLVYRDKINVKTITLDEYVSTHSAPSVIKIDVEGLESMVIQGGKDFLQNNAPIITVEIWPDKSVRAISCET